MSNMRKTLNIIGCGKVGQVLGRLWINAGTFNIRQVLNQSLESGERAAAFMQGGRAISSYDELEAADLYLIGTPDDRIADSCERLAQTGILRPDSIVFHCSGALPSAVLVEASRYGAAIASIHPIRSFATPEETVRVFPGTFCGCEGDLQALTVLNAALTDIGAIPVPIEAEFKNLYHSAAVFASNYLVTLLDTAMQAYMKSGVPYESTLQLMEPLVRGTVDNVFRLGPTEALTGPIARGDIATAVKQYRAVNAWDPQYGTLYKHCAKLTADIAARKKMRETDKS